MSSDDKKRPIVRYIDRDFASIRESLDRLAQQYTPQVNTDKSVANFATQLFDSVAYIGDVLSFNLDYSINETFPDTAIQPNNLIRHSENRGFKYQPNPAAFGIATFYIKVPSNSAGTGPDLSVAPVLRRGTEVQSAGGAAFILIEDVDFSRVNLETRVAAEDPDTGAVTQYVIRGYGQVTSGEVRREEVVIGDYRRFQRVSLGTPNITEVISVTDSSGKRWFEVPYLSQDVVYRPVVNRDSGTNEVASAILRPFPVPRRFVVYQSRGSTELQFGHGSSDAIDGSRPTEPSNVALNVYAKPFVADESFDPGKLISNDKLGVAPANTTLSVLVRVNTRANVNVSPGRLNEISNPIFDFGGRRTVIPQAVINQVVSSLEVDNDQQITGDVTFPTADEFRVRMRDAYASQNRAVTARDYVATAYRMPGQFGKIKRASVAQDRSSFRRNLNMYVVAEGADGKLARANVIIKNNLKNWLAQYKMIGDTIDILDAKIVNIGIRFVVVGNRRGGGTATRSRIVNRLAEEFLIPYEIGQPIDISSLYRAVNQVEGVNDTVDIEILSRRGGVYSDTRLNINENISPDGRMLMVPEDTILEVKFPNIDIEGVIR